MGRSAEPANAKPIGCVSRYSVQWERNLESAGLDDRVYTGFWRGAMVHV